nr:ABC transporter permease [uncultured Holophaga sp.]
MRGMLLVCRKEFLELFKDRRTVFFTFFLPLLLYPVLFSMIAGLSRSDEAQRRSRPSRVVLVDPGGLLRPLLEAQPASFELVPPPAGDLRQAIRDQRLEMEVRVDPEAVRLLGEERTFSLAVSCDPGDDASALALQRLRQLMREQDRQWVAERLRRAGAPSELDRPSRIQVVEMGDPGLKAGRLLGSMLPYLLMLMMFAGSMQHGIYATAGEKERGTLLCLLSTRIPRAQIILGKLLYVFSIGVISAVINLFSMGGSVALALRGAAGTGGNGSLTMLANPSLLALTFLLMVPLGLVFANFIVLMGVQARNSVEAGTSIMPGMVVVMVMAVFSMAPGIEKLAFLPYLPILNVSLAIRKLFGQQGNTFEYLLALLMTLALAALFTWLSTRRLDRDDTVFRL